MFKEQLMSTLKTAVDQHNAGLSDDDAVVKAACEAGFNQEQTRRLAEVYNTTKTICFFKTAEDRTVSFTTADPEKVVGRLFPAEAKKAEAPRRALMPDYGEYDEPVRETKAAEEIFPLKKSDFFDRTIDNILNSGYRIIDSEKQSAAYCANEAGQIAARYSMLLEKISQDVGRGAYAYGDNMMSDMLAYVRDAYGDRADALAGDLRARLPKYAEKTASQGLTDFELDSPGTAAMLDEAAEAKLAWAELKACEADFAKMAAEHEDEMLKAAGVISATEEQEDFFADGLRSRVKAAAGDTYDHVSMMDRLAGTEDPETTKTTKLDVLGPVFEMMGGGAGDAAKKEISTGVSKAIRGPADRENSRTTDRLRNFQRQIMLEELMMTDPILSGVDPKRVAQAYETVSRLAPEVSLNKEVVRAILRASTNAEAVSTYDAKQLAELETEIRRQTMVPQSPDRINIKV